MSVKGEWQNQETRDKDKVLSW